MRGQTEKILVVTDRLLPQGTNEYRYEVIDEGSEFAGKIDIAYAERDLVLQAGHAYEVRFNDNSKKPRIIELIRELERTPSETDEA